MVKLLEKRIIELIEQHKALNIRALCRLLNNVTKIDFCTWRGRAKSQYWRCKNNGCKIHYFPLMTLVGRMVKQGIIKRKKLRLPDLDKQGLVVTNKRKDLFSILYLDEEAFKECYHIKNTLLAYIA